MRRVDKIASAVLECNNPLSFYLCRLTGWTIGQMHNDRRFVLTQQPDNPLMRLVDVPVITA
jgi:hypothetical protein